ncbi:MAG: dienelactone hydrolase family protein [Pyrinomonadaceae bacterium]
MEQKYIELYDKYTHSADMSRRDFLDRLAKLAGSGALALALLPSLENNYAEAGTISTSDKRLTTDYIEYDGASGKMRAYLALPAKAKKDLPAVVVIHENRGLNQHIEDVARRAALEGFMALAPDALSPLGGTPADMDEARGMFSKLDREKTVKDFVAAVTYLKNDPRSNGRVGCVGFCWGGSMANQLAVNSEDLKAAVAFYGGQPKAEDVPRIKAALMLHYAGLDQRINQGIPAYEKALKDAKVDYQLFTYENVNHAFHNDTNEARYNAEAAKLAWQRTIDFFKKHLIAQEKPKEKTKEKEKTKAKKTK